MASYLPKFLEWLSLRESNARKRARRAAMNGTGPDLPASYAACPDTDVNALKRAKKHGVITSEAKGQHPDYSFTSWLQKADKLKDDIESLEDQGEKDTEQLGKDARNKPATKDDPKKKDDPKSGDQETKWSKKQDKKDQKDKPKPEMPKEVKKDQKPNKPQIPIAPKPKHGQPDKKENGSEKPERSPKT